MDKGNPATLEESARRIGDAKATNVERWQRTTLPFVQWGIGLLAVVVFGTLIFAGTVILPGIVKGSDHARGYSEAATTSLTASAPNLEAAKVSIMAYQSARQHDRASAALLTRELLRFAGFLIGAALCFVGALFIMGKFADSESSTAIVEGQGYHASLASSSPGIFALVIGGGLVSVGIFAHYRIEVRDPFILEPSGVTLFNSPALNREKLSDRGMIDFDELCNLDPENAQCG